MAEWIEYNGKNRPSIDERVEVDLGRGESRKGYACEFDWFRPADGVPKYGHIHRYRIIPEDTHG